MALPPRQPSEFEVASIHRSDVIIAALVEQTTALKAIQWHARGVTAFLVLLLGLAVLSTLLGIMR